jgi:acetyl esterase
MEKNKLDILKRISPSMREVIEFERLESEKRHGQKKASLIDREAYEASRSFFNEGGPQMVRTLRTHVDSENKRIPFTVHYPVEKKKNRLIIFIHGGGFVVGSPESHDGIMRRLADETGAVVMGIDYALAPETKFPVQIHECIELIHHVRRNEGLYDIDKDDITLAGDSAGAYLSLATTLYLRDKEKATVFLKSLLLYYGSYGLIDSMSMRLYGGEFDGLTLEALRSYGAFFASEEDMENPYRNLFNNDLTYGLPPIYIMACTLDPLSDDSRLLHAILKEHGMTSEYKEYDGVIHGFLHYSKMMNESMEAIRDSARFYKEMKDES